MHHQAIAFERTAFIRRGAMHCAALALLCALGPARADAHPSNVAALIGDARCDADAQCRTVAVGARRCGGPAAYLAWSTKRTDAAALTAAVVAANASPADDDSRNSTCGVVADPGAYCAKPGATAGLRPGVASAPAAGQCRLRARTPGGAALVDR